MSDRKWKQRRESEREIERERERDVCVCVWGKVGDMEQFTSHMIKPSFFNEHDDSQT